MSMLIRFRHTALDVVVMSFTQNRIASRKWPFVIFLTARFSGPRLAASTTNGDFQRGLCRLLDKLVEIHRCIGDREPAPHDAADHAGFSPEDCRLPLERR